ncbi:hypothetical protein [Poriferisphaera sp. WC338]|uniref:hypothetical protein n=1 Tax=Poriferisphaera sp. WC338 TaxID=3425129 RepID=UPI003D8192E3
MKLKMMQGAIALIVFVLMFGVVATGQVVSGERLPVAGEGWSTLAKGMSNQMVGVVDVYGGARPDVMLTTGKFSKVGGLFLMKYLGDSATGQPRFGNDKLIKVPFKTRGGTNGHAFNGRDGRVHVWLLNKGKVMRYVLDRDRYELIESASPLVLSGHDGNVTRISVRELEDGRVQMAMVVRDAKPYRPEGYWRAPEYHSFDGRGSWRGNRLYAHLEQVMIDSVEGNEIKRVKDISADHQDILHHSGLLARVQLESDEPEHLIAGTWFGLFQFYNNVGEGKEGTQYEGRMFVKDDDEGLILRHPAINPRPLEYKNRKTGLMSDLIVSGEAGTFWYEFSGKYDEGGNPIYKDPQYAQSNSGNIYFGSLPVLNSVDWDDDGDEDLIVGNSQGFVMFHENVGSNAAPQYAEGEYMTAGGEVILAQPGYRDIQGPEEARWGYTTPTVVDWDGDGDLDLMLRSAADGQYFVENVGSKTEPKLAKERILYCHGLELHGTWRVQPAVGIMGGRMAYIMLDDDDAFHLYERIDNQNVRDIGKLKLDDGSVITGNFLHAGGTGRLKMVLVDWDLDGVKDLMVSGPRHASVPNPVDGLPKQTGKKGTGLKGASVLFMKNVGSESEPVYAYPKFIKYKGKPIFVGQHSCSGVPTSVGAKGGPNMFLAYEDGYAFYYDRKDLSWHD